MINACTSDLTTPSTLGKSFALTSAGSSAPARLTQASVGAVFLSASAAFRISSWPVRDLAYSRRMLAETGAVDAM
ncbi:hypothetical protein WJ12_13305 [Burkholderia seminalis]|nr:hypothetical protein WJ12_13305 [Burkholderia seminalis]